MKDVALITGGSSGIGKELAAIHASRGGDLILVARSEADLDACKRELEAAHRVAVVTIALDLSAPSAPRELYDVVVARGVSVEYLVNNAGFGGQGSFWERDWSRDEEMINLNVKALTQLCRLFAPDFVARNRGRILNTGSTAGLMPGPLQAVYYATKAYVNSFSLAIAEELSDTRVTVTALLPPATETRFAKAGGLEDTPLFSKNLADARVVARDGYEGMMRGDLLVYGGVSTRMRLGLALIPLLPTRTVTSRIKKAQDVRR